MNSGRATFMIVMFWSPATHNGMITGDTFFTRNTEPLLFDFNHSKYMTYAFIGIYGRTRSIEYQYTSK